MGTIYTKSSCHTALSLLSHKTYGPGNPARTVCHQLYVHEVAKLTLRCQAGQGKGADKLPDQSGLPDEYMDALIQSLDIQCERFASPLNLNPAVKQYYSLHEQDRVFGANADAYSTKWEGASEANPPHDAEAMEKAVRWAIFSAEKSI